jgi:hypothetical protein
MSVTTSKARLSAILDELYARQVAEAENGKATSLGGTNRLRGYSTNRFMTVTQFPWCGISLVCA